MIRDPAEWALARNIDEAETKLPANLAYNQRKSDLQKRFFYVYVPSEASVCVCVCDSLELQAPCESPDQDKFLKTQTEKTNWKCLKTCTSDFALVPGTLRLVGEETILVNAECNLVILTKAQTAPDTVIPLL